MGGKKVCIFGANRCSHLVVNCCHVPPFSTTVKPRYNGSKSNKSPLVTHFKTLPLISKSFDFYVGNNGTPLIVNTICWSFDICSIVYSPNYFLSHSRMLIMTRRNYPLAMERGRWKSRGPLYTEKGIMFRSVKTDQSSLTNTLHYLR